MKHISTTLFLALCLSILASATLGCGGGIKDDPILRLSAEEALAEGKSLLEQEKYNKARRHLIHAFEVEPNSRSGREALLLVADTYYLQGGRLNFIQAETKYRDFLNRFPTSDQAAYAQFQLANSLAKRIGRADRDQSSTIKAYEAFEELMRLYPTSEYAEQAGEQIRLVVDSLAEHEFVVGYFYQRYGNHLGAIERFEYLLENYSKYPERDKVLFYLGSSYREGKTREYKLKALSAFKRLREEFPESEYISDIPQVEVPPPQEASDGDAETQDKDEGPGEGSEQRSGAVEENR